MRPGLAGVTAIAVRNALNFAVTATGGVVVWADLDHELTGVVKVLAAGDLSLALRKDGTLMAWGDNADGCTSLALQADGKVVGWGQALSGQSALLPRLKNVSAITAFDSYAVARLGDEPPSASLPLRDAAWNAGEFTFRFTPSRGSVCSVEYTDSLDLVRWTALPLTRGGGVELRWTDSEASGSRRFYRVREW